jgi:transcriptional regulator with XRE-family HTH domain
MRLKEARLAKGLSQKALGLAIGMDEFSASPRMNHYERGRHAPDFSILSQIAQLLEVPTAYFYAEEDWLAEAIKVLANLPKSQRNKLLKAR